MNNKQTVAVAMSGGVDSSVAAKLLLDQGYNVLGLTLRLWGAKTDENNRSIAERDAAKVAALLGIEHHVLDCTDYFKTNIVGNFIGEYQKAHTPNPCVLCNKLIKFGLLFDEAMKLQADFLATGHYVQKYIAPESGKHYLRKAADLSKDQTYVLYNIPHDKLQACLFPLGTYSKPQVRELAQSFALPVFDKADSQEICFIPDDDYRGFLAAHSDIKPLAGNLVDPQGKVLGRHQGLINYTIGQRKGFNIGFGKKMYVIALDKTKNEVVIGDDSQVFQNSLEAQEVVFVDRRPADRTYPLQVKIRYNAKPADAQVTVDGSSAKVVFATPQRAITPGQSAVFYENDILVGGGIIK